MVTPGVVPSPSAAPAAPAPASALPRRRNGKPQSCEPCRLAKTACDHTFPKCNRCVRRGIDARCTYHPSPMTKAQGSPKVIQHTEPWKKHCQLARTATPNILSLLAQQRSPVATPQGISNARGERDTEAQYLGSTSYSAVFQENKESIGSEVWNGPSSIDLSCVKGQDSDSHRLRLALSALRAIPDQDVCELLLDSDFEVHASPLHEPATRYCLQSLWDTYGDALRDRDDDGRIRQMAQEILRNTDTPVSPQPTSAEWLESHTGKNLRFEMVGTLLALFALALPVLPDQHPVYRAQDLSPFEYTYKLGKAAENCQMVCFDMSIVNEFSLYLNYHLQVTQGIVRGEDSGFFWRKSGHTATTITALGLHRESTITKSAPFMVAEIRKRMFMASFIVDKQLATLFGRPPRLSRRYSNCSLALDLDDQEIMLQGDDLSDKISKLDSKGWKTEGKVTLVGCMRATMIASLIRDEVLELCLGPESGCTAQRREEVKLKSTEAFASLPSQFQYSPAPELPELTTVELSSIITLKLEFLLNTYLLDRLPTEDAQQNKQSLITTAIEILSIIIPFFGRGDVAGGFFVSSSRLHMYFGIPAAGVLAVELLKQHQYPKRYSLVLPRSQVIRDLSVFNHYLDMVTPYNGNYVVCSRIHKVIEKVLEQVLDPSAVPTMVLDRDGDGDTVAEPDELPDDFGDLPEPDMPAVVGPIGDMEFMEWMNAVDWTKGPWTETI